MALLCKFPQTTFAAHHFTCFSPFVNALAFLVCDGQLILCSINASVKMLSRQQVVATGQMLWHCSCTYRRTWIDAAWHFLETSFWLSILRRSYVYHNAYACYQYILISVSVDCIAEYLPPIGVKCKLKTLLY